jgi:multidrug efflux pump subunit AcrA (membrane-fusion protein)
VALVARAVWPVHLTVLAPGELVPAQPAVLRAPMDGVVEQIHVQPNEMVKQGQLLFSLDEAQIASRLEVSEQALQTAEAEYRQFAQLALGDMRSKSQLAALAGKIGERRAEQAFLTDQRQRAQVLAPRDGMVLFDASSEWIGKPVQTGERVMRIAQPDVVEVEAWLPMGDAIELQAGATVQLYLAADPLSAVQAKVRYVAYEAVPRPDGSYAYRVRAELPPSGKLRIGLKGTAKLQGEKVSLVYWMVRKPWASIRQWVAL